MIDKSVLEAAMTEAEMDRLSENQSRQTRVADDILVYEARIKHAKVTLLGLRAMKMPPPEDRVGYDFGTVIKRIGELDEELEKVAKDLISLKDYQTHLVGQNGLIYNKVAERLVADPGWALKATG